DPIRLLKGHTNSVTSAMFNLSGDTIVTSSYDNTAKIWDTETGEIIATLAEHKAFVKSAAFNKAGNRVITSSNDKTAIIWGINQDFDYLDKDTDELPCCIQ
ncbi:hypothetical protein H0X06_06395, partial [Candidatus Dependentiae bacterium]|nr:hypothetical protein [Candidatus Dependentiae bacterium]